MPREGLAVALRCLLLVDFPCCNALVVFKDLPLDGLWLVDFALGGRLGVVERGLVAIAVFTVTCLLLELDFVLVVLEVFVGVLAEGGEVLDFLGRTRFLFLDCSLSSVTILGVDLVVFVC